MNNGTSVDKTLILGLGNTIISDDGIGIYIVRALKTQLVDLKDVEFQEASIGGMRLLDLLANKEKAFIIDSIKGGTNQPGSVSIYKLTPQTTAVTQSPYAGHTISLSTVLALGQELGYNMPSQVVILAVEIVDNETISEKLTPQLEQALPEIIKKITAEIEKEINC